MKYAIQKTSGQWWTGECWGVQQAREEYGPTWAELPMFLEFETPGGWVLVMLDIHATNPLDARYYLVEYSETDAVASVWEID